jgi:hypothetical protein
MSLLLNFYCICKWSGHNKVTCIGFEPLMQICHGVKHQGLKPGQTCGMTFKSSSSWNALGTMDSYQTNQMDDGKTNEIDNRENALVGAQRWKCQKKSSDLHKNGDLVGMVFIEMYVRFQVKILIRTLIFSWFTCEFLIWPSGRTSNWASHNNYSNYYDHITWS